MRDILDATYLDTLGRRLTEPLWMETSDRELTREAAAAITTLRVALDVVKHLPTDAQDLYNSNVANFNRALAAEAALAEMTRENATLAAGQCIVKNGLLGDDHGNQYCSVVRERDAARTAALEEAATMLDDGALYLNRLRDPGMANHLRSWAAKVRALSRPQADGTEGE